MRIPSTYGRPLTGLLRTVVCAVMIAGVTPAIGQEDIRSQEGLDVYLAGKFGAGVGNTYYSLENALKEVSKVERLILSNQEMTEVPAELMQLTNLKYLDLSRNKLTNIPSTLDKLTQLEEVNLSDNALKEIPSSVCSLTSLKVLKLGGNQISSLSGLSCLKTTQLEKLALQGNEISSVSNSDLSNVKTVKYLTLQGNEFYSFPDVICSFESLNLLVLPNDVLFQTPSCLKYWREVTPVYQVWSREHAMNYMNFNSSGGSTNSTGTFSGNSRKFRRKGSNNFGMQSHHMRLAGNGYYTLRVDYPDGFRPMNGIQLASFALLWPINIPRYFISKKYHNKLVYTSLKDYDRKIDRLANKDNPSAFRLKRLERLKRRQIRRLR